MIPGGHAHAVDRLNETLQVVRAEERAASNEFMEFYHRGRAQSLVYALNLIDGYKSDR